MEPNEQDRNSPNFVEPKLRLTMHAPHQRHKADKINDPWYRNNEQVPVNICESLKWRHDTGVCLTKTISQFPPNVFKNL